MIGLLAIKLEHMERNIFVQRPQLYWLGGAHSFNKEFDIKMAHSKRLMSKTRHFDVILPKVSRFFVVFVGF